MRKTLFLLTCSLLLLSACSETETIEATTPEESTPKEPTPKATSSFSIDSLEECDVEDEVKWVEEDSGFIAEQMTACYQSSDATFVLLSAPNMNWAGIETRAWEAEGNTAWAGVLVRESKGSHEEFFKIPEEGFNPVGLYLREDALILDTVAGDGAGSGEGTLQRYAYPFDGVVTTKLYTWQKERCTGYYVPETYDWETYSCE